MMSPAGGGARDRLPALSLSAEGFAGSRNESAPQLAKSESWAPKRAGGSANARFPSSPSSAVFERILPLYYRHRQLVFGTEKSGHRVPARLQQELRMHEQTLTQELRPLHPQLFQHFDQLQLDRFLRAMPFLRLSKGRWVYGGEGTPAWQEPGERSFLLLSGCVALFMDPAGVGGRTEVRQGTVFGETYFSLGDDSVETAQAAAAHCEEPCIIGVLNGAVLEAAFADRAFGNRRIAQQVKAVPALGRVVNTNFHDNGRKTNAEMNLSGVVMNAVAELSKTAAKLHVAPGKEVLGDDMHEESMLIVTKGQVEVRADVTLAEKLEALAPKRVRIRVHVDRAEKLAGDSIFDKLDPYCIVKLGNFKRFQTPVLWNAGPHPRFDYAGVLTFQNEDTLEFVVMDHDTMSADDLLGTGSISIAELHDGWSGKIQLMRPKRGIFKTESAMMEEPAGFLFISVKWDYEKVSAMTRVPKSRRWADQELFTLKANDCWGHEQLILGALFKRTLEQATANTKYSLVLENFYLKAVAAPGKYEPVACLKASRRRFMEFLKRCGREKQFIQACRLSATEKQSSIRELASRLARQWQDQEQAELMRNGIYEVPTQEEVIDPSRFRVAYRGTKARIIVRNALNLSGGGWFDKLDPYVTVKFRGASAEFRTSVLEDAGNDPIWNEEGEITYYGEVALEVSVFDYDTYSSDDFLGSGTLQVDQFCQGFEGMVPLTTPGKRRNLERSMIVIGVQWEQPSQEPALALGNSMTSATALTSDLRLLTTGAFAQR